MKIQNSWENVGYKEWIGLLAAPVFWLASLVCFALGLAFKTGSGIFIPGTTTDVTLLFSLGLGLANTAIQIVGNDTDKEDLGVALLLMWGASYMLGIGSNVNYLYSIVGLSNGYLQFLVCWGLGIMIEVAPERLVVRFLRAAGILGGLPISRNIMPPANPPEHSRQGRRQSQQQDLSPSLAHNTQSYGRGEGRAEREQRHQQIRKTSIPIIQDDDDVPEFVRQMNIDPMRSLG